MTAGVPCTGEKAIKAGVVREFKNIVFADNSADVEGEMFEIYNEAVLLEFADMVASGMFDYAGAVVTRPLNYSGEWTPIEGYSLTFDGGGYTIAGLNAPLFGTTNATIKNLNIKTNVTLTEDLVWGAIARELVAKEGKQGELINCDVVEGSTLTINLTEQTLTVVADDSILDSNHMVHIGALVGRVQGGAMTRCNSYGTLNINGLPSANAHFAINIGGLAGSIGSNGYLLTAEGATATLGAATECKNFGAVNIKGVDRETSTVTHIGGLTGHIYTATLAKCENSGKITVDSPNIMILFCGGLIGKGESAFATTAAELKITDLKNTGDIELTSLVTRILAIGGIGGYITGNYYECQRAVNEGNISSAATISDTGHYLQIGGIIGRSGVFLTECVNGVEGDPTKGTITLAGTVNKADDDVSCAIAGISAYSHGATVVSGCVNHAALNVSEAFNTATSGVSATLVGGIAAYRGSDAASARLTNCTNKGPITAVYSPTKTQPRIGGVVGKSGPVMDGLYNEGAINVTIKNDLAVEMWIAGIVSVIAKTTTIDGGANSGAINVTVEKSHAANAGIAGCFGSVNNTVHNFTNTGAITANLNNKRTVNIGGVMAIYQQVKCDLNTNLKNSGKITVKGKMMNDITTAYGLFVAGISATMKGGLTFDRTGEDDATYYSNNGDIDIDVDNTTENPIYLYVGGVSGAHYGPIIGGVNRGKITVDGGDKGYHQIFLGGCIARKYVVTLSSYGGAAPVENCQNYGDFEHRAKTALVNTYHSCGGIIGQGEDGSTSKTKPTFTVSNINNYGHISAYDTGGNLSIASLIAVGYCALNDITVSDKGSVTAGGSFNSLRMGGAIATSGGTATSGCVTTVYKNVVNNAPLKVLDGTKLTGHVKNAAGVYAGLWMGGIVAFHNMERKYVSVTKSTNNAAITVENVDATSTVIVGGLVGAIQSGYGALSELEANANYNTAPINVSGKCSRAFIGGITGAQTFGDADGNNLNFNSGSVTVDMDVAEEYSVGGIAGINLGMLKASENSGTVTVSGKTETNAYIGGLIGRKNSSRISTDCSNKGAVNASVDAALVTAIGGIAGFMNNVAIDYANMINKGDVEFVKGATCRGDLLIGGIVGWQHFPVMANYVTAQNYGTGIQPATNEGRVICSGSNEKDCYMGGIAGYTAREGEQEYTLPDNTTVTYVNSAGCYTHTIVSKDEAGLVTEFAPAEVSHTNTGYIRFAGSTRNLYAGGVVGFQDGTETGASSSTTTPAYNGIYEEAFVSDVAGQLGIANYVPFFRTPTE